mmetsp:Transcript_20658/g.55781  ORF Transcript_20658/g.55781 Transcript_20658/m.55781 type:complete len:230 (+) Transcript_20658:43-732(+)
MRACGRRRVAAAVMDVAPGAWRCRRCRPAVGGGICSAAACRRRLSARRVVTVIHQCVTTVARGPRDQGIKPHYPDARDARRPPFTRPRAARVPPRTVRHTDTHVYTQARPSSFGRLPPRAWRVLVLPSASSTEVDPRQPDSVGPGSNISPLFSLRRRVPAAHCRRRLRGKTECETVRESPPGETPSRGKPWPHSRRRGCRLVTAMSELAAVPPLVASALAGTAVPRTRA